MSIAAFAIASGHNADGKNDSTGAFQPGAQKFARAFECPWRTFDNMIENAAARRKNFFDTIQQNCPGGTNYFAYFGHGIAQGPSSPRVYEADGYGHHLDAFLEVLKPKIARPFVAAFYACSCGAANGWTAKMRERLGGDGVWIYGHTTVGHSFLNPDVSEEASDESPTYRLLYPSGHELRAPWAEALKYTDLWLRFPWLWPASIDDEVNARRLLGTWEVKAGGATQTYEFDMPATVWVQSGGRDYDTPPSGTVKAFAGKAKGTPVDAGRWTIDSQLDITWDSGPVETWPIPLRAVGQTGTGTKGVVAAQRLQHALGHGKIQG